MSDTLLVSIALGVIAGLFGVLMAVLGWLGNRIYNKLDEVAKSIAAMYDRVGEVKDELHDRITGIDKRVTRIETMEETCPVNMKRRAGGNG